MPFRCLFITGFIFFCAGLTVAQPQKSNIFIRTNLLSLIEPNGNAGPTIGLEFFLTDHLSAGSDVGIVLYNYNVLGAGSDQSGNPYGYKIKPELRYYLYKKNRSRRARMFFSLEGLFLKTNTPKYNPLPVLDNTGNVVYNYLAGYDEVKKVKGIVTKAGVQIPRFIFKKMMIEFYAGVGIRDKRYSYENFPAGASVPDRNFGRVFSVNIDGTYPSISGGFKLVYKIK
jgi:hypothetical protein